MGSALRRLQATVFLGRHFFLHLLRKLVGRRAGGLLEFVGQYQQDGVFALRASDQEIFSWLERCLLCHLCDAACVGSTISPWSRPAWLIKIASRSLTHWREIQPAQDCLSCRHCESFCPVQIPIASVLSYLQKRGQEIAQIGTLMASGDRA